MVKKLCFVFLAIALCARTACVCAQSDDQPPRADQSIDSRLQDQESFSSDIVDAAEPSAADHDPQELHSQADVTPDQSAQSPELIVSQTSSEPQNLSVQPVEIDGDNVEFMQEENKVIINGNVSIARGDTTLRCDHVEYYHATKQAIASGNVVLSSPKGQIRGQSLKFNFETMTGDFEGAKIIADPYYGQGEMISKVADNKIEMTRGYITSCDLDKPHYKIYSKKIDIHPQDKVQAKSVRMLVGKAPLFYLPSFTQVINDKKPRVTYTPGYKKEWGMFLLTAWRYYFNENFKGALHVDFRERKDVAVGGDLNYQIPGFGEGLIKTYYMNERTINAKRWFQERRTPTIEKERFKAEWRHKWQIDETSQFVSQYYKLSDNDFLKDYFEREHDRDSQPTTFFLYTKNFGNGTFSLRTDKRVNRFTSTVERLPEMGYNISSQQIAGSNFYLQSNNLFSHMTYPNASPTEIRLHTTRLDSQNRISYPTKVGFIDITPFVGQRETFYTRTKDPSRYHITRSVFETGANLSTKFYRTFDVHADLWGIEIDRIRHIINPSVEYRYAHTPSFPAQKLDVFDSSIDSLTRGHRLDFTLENRFQTKRDNKNIDFLRIVGKTDFLLKENQTYDGTSVLSSKGSFNTVTSDIEFRPIDWLTFYSDTSYSAQESRLTSANFEVYVNEGKRWWFSIGKRYQVDMNDQITAEIGYTLNPKWKFRIYERFEVSGEGQKEQQYIITRDLHCWEMDMAFNERGGQGSEIWVVFRLKAFPDLSIDFMNTSFNRRKAGSQSSEGL
ncbi:MAG TPA: LPS assembly protein LptD [Candidatus Omnitrophota bacterium]|nr:LPS assembly protein LptD [Candidatus Omnitrophota bacterium]